MLIKTITDYGDGRRWEIYKKSEDDYSYKYYEYFTQCGWRFTQESNSYSKDAIEWEFDCSI